MPEIGRLMPQLLTIAEASAYLRVSRKTLESWRGKEREPRGPKYHKIGKHVRYAAEDLETWVKARAVEPKGF